MRGGFTLGLNTMDRGARKSSLTEPSTSGRGPERRIASRLKAPLIGLVLSAALAGCVTQTQRHGHLFTDTDLQQVQAGMTVDQVHAVLGTPDTTSTIGGNAHYYISSTTQGSAMMQPKEVDRTVVAVYFNQFGTVDQIANYTMQDGKVFDTIARTTPAAKKDKSFIERIFSGVGKTKVYDPEAQ